VAIELDQVHRYSCWRKGHRLQNLPSDAVGYGVGGNLIEVLAQRGNCVDADDTGDDLNGPSMSQSIETESRPRNQALHETSRRPSLSW
jgi:hypothetical protein